MLVYHDICCFNRPFDDQSQLRVRLEAEAKLSIQEKIRAGSIKLAWSYMVDFENTANPFEERSNAISKMEKPRHEGHRRFPGYHRHCGEIESSGIRQKRLHPSRLRHRHWLRLFSHHGRRRAQTLPPRE